MGGLGFAKPKVPKFRKFKIELKHREGEEEETLGWLDLEVPRLGNSQLEIQWCFLELWKQLLA